MALNPHAPLVIDIETVPIKDIQQYLDDIRAPRSYKSQDAIDRYVEKKGAEAVNEAALDPDLCRVCCLGIGTSESDIRVAIAEDEDREREVLRRFWSLVDGKQHGKRLLIGYNILDFDVPVLIRRSLYLGIKAVRYGVDRFRHPDIIDMQQDLSWQGKIKYRTVDFYCRRLGINVPDEYSGKDVPVLWLAKNYDAVKAHCRADVLKEILLAQRLGHLVPVAEAPAPVINPSITLEDVPF